MKYEYVEPNSPFQRGDLLAISLTVSIIPLFNLAVHLSHPWDYICIIVLCVIAPYNGVLIRRYFYLVDGHASIKRKNRK